MPPATLPASTVEPDGSTVVRLLSYNVRSLRQDTAALARVIRACAPDVVCVQEAPRFFRWRKHAARLARSVGLTHVTGGATTTGPMILAALRAHVEQSADLLLPRTPGLHRRGLATAVLRFGSATRLGVVSCHLSLQAEERYAQAGLVRQHTAALDAPHAVLAGDLNESPSGRSFGHLAGTFVDAYVAAPWGTAETFSAHRPERRIDAVLTTPDVRVLGCGVPRGLPGVTDADLRAASDHLPVLAVVRIPGPQAHAPARREG